MKHSERYLPVEGDEIRVDAQAWSDALTMFQVVNTIGKRMYDRGIRVAHYTKTTTFKLVGDAWMVGIRRASPLLCFPVDIDIPEADLVIGVQPQFVDILVEDPDRRRIDAQRRRANVSLAIGFWWQIEHEFREKTIFDARVRETIIGYASVFFDEILEASYPKDPTDMLAKDILLHRGWMMDTGLLVPFECGALKAGRIAQTALGTYRNPTGLGYYAMDCDESKYESYGLTVPPRSRDELVAMVKSSTDGSVTHG